LDLGLRGNWELVEQARKERYSHNRGLGKEEGDNRRQVIYGDLPIESAVLESSQLWSEGTLVNVG
jgi:hypothetical protein